MSSAEAPGATPALLAVLRERIGRHGPLRLDAFMSLALADPDYGYWRRGQALGAAGDFITAPEISQVFGEIVGLWAVSTWQKMGEPAPLRLIELGPGRGTLLDDGLRAAAAVSPAFVAQVAVHLIELSPVLRGLQAKRLSARHLGAIAWHQSLAEVPAGPAIVIGNEFLDALPIRQLVFGDGVWRERMVGSDGRDGLAFELGDVAEFAGHAPACPGDVAEIRSGEDAILAALRHRAAPLVALFIDYGPAEPAYGDTLQAVRRHAYVAPLADPGGSDLTAHVQFAGLAAKARALGLISLGPMPQAEFFGRLGMAERAARLMARNPAAAQAIETAVKRLLAPAGMGSQFKVLIVTSPGLPTPEPFAP